MYADEVEVQFEILHLANLAGTVHIAENPASEASPVHILAQTFVEFLPPRRIGTLPVQVFRAHLRILYRMRIEVIHILFGHFRIYVEAWAEFQQFFLEGLHTHFRALQIRR